LHTLKDNLYVGATSPEPNVPCTIINVHHGDGNAKPNKDDVKRILDGVINIDESSAPSVSKETRLTAAEAGDVDVTGGWTVGATWY